MLVFGLVLAFTPLPTKVDVEEELDAGNTSADVDELALLFALFAEELLEDDTPALFNLAKKRLGREETSLELRLSWPLATGGGVIGLVSCERRGAGEDGRRIPMVFVKCKRDACGIGLGKP